MIWCDSFFFFFGVRKISTPPNQNLDVQVLIKGKYIEPYIPKESRRENAFPENFEEEISSWRYVVSMLSDNGG